MSVLSPGVRQDVERARILDKESKSLTIKKK
ncbi:MAG: hypothetical protein ACD_67C00039G0005 [uncultured bacterium]|nr:MAG: hypothetical protein ACD_67C00039G0005 [uncultured bacterium]